MVLSCYRRFVIDDSAQQRKLLTRILESGALGPVAQAESGPQALQLLDATDVDVDLILVLATSYLRLFKPLKRR